VRESEKEILKQQISGKNFKVFLWPDKPKDIPDTPQLKLVLIQKKDEDFMKNILETKGDSPRVYRNTIFFLCSSDVERITLTNSIKKIIAFKQIQTDKTLKLTEEQRREVGNNIRKEEDSLKDILKRCYKLAYVPAKDGVKEIDLGMPTYGETIQLDEWVYEGLRAEQEISEKILPDEIELKYLGDKDFVKVQLIYESMLKTLGERRLVSSTPLKESILQGVRNGLFGIGEVKEDGQTVICKHFKEDAAFELDESKVIIKRMICEAQKGAVSEALSPPSNKDKQKDQEEKSTIGPPVPERSHLILKFDIPRGKVSQIMGMMHFLQGRFAKLKVTIEASEGSITEGEYESKIKETLRQLGVHSDEE
jgi:hypothetical protein